MTELRRLVWDIESSPLLGYSWKKWDTSLIEIVEDWKLLCFSWQWLDGPDKKVHVLGMPDDPLYQPGVLDDEWLTEQLHDLLSQADISIAHNGKGFDDKKANAKFLEHGYGPVPFRKSVDTLRTARREFKLSSNSLKDVCAFLNVTLKQDPGGFATWKGCMKGDEKAWKHMYRYAKGDIRSLVDAYWIMLPFDKTHPNLSVYTGKEACPRCQSKHYQKRGTRYANAYSYPQYQCQACKGYFAGRRSDRDTPKVLFKT